MQVLCGTCFSSVLGHSAAWSSWSCLTWLVLSRVDVLSVFCSVLAAPRANLGRGSKGFTVQGQKGLATNLVSDCPLGLLFWIEG